MSKKDYDIKTNFKVGIKVREMPEEVAWYAVAYGLSRGIGVGRKFIERMQEIEEKYPEWFPWEQKYKSIPKEVHEAYRKEKLGFDINNLGEWRDKELSKGWLTMLEEDAMIVEFNIEDKPIQTLLDEAWNEMEKVKLRVIDDEKKDKALWDKHYKKYKLPWRK